MNALYSNSINKLKRSLHSVFKPFVSKRTIAKKMSDYESLPQTPPQGGGRKRLSVERIYQKKSQLEHILLRPDTYIGSVEPVTQAMWVYDEGEGMVNREITYVPGLYKIFDEILVNAADNKQRDSKMSTIKININPEKNLISVWNDGKGIPVVEHKVEKMYVPEMIFGHLLTSSNYNDEDKKVTGGRNGYGAKLCNIFSTKFKVETASRDEKKIFSQVWSDNMSKTHERKIKSYDKSDFTCVTFQPDLAKFHMESLDKDTVALLSRRAFDVAGSTHGVKVFLNGSKLPVKNFKEYVQLYVAKLHDEGGDPLKIIHEQVNPRWEICLTSSDKGFQQVSFVNGIATTKGGRHTDYVIDQVAKKLVEVVKRKNKGGVEVKPFQIKNHCWLFVNCLIENPTFDSQTKENMTLQAKKFGSQCTLTEKFLKSASSSGIVDNIMNWVKFKAQSQLQKKSAGKSNKLKGVPKLDDANDAGTKHSMDCTLILTEGDSAKTLAVSGLSVVGRDKYGVFPLRGKLLNVRDASHKQIMDNAEINNIVKIMGLSFKKKYDSDDDLKSLRYGRIMIMTDQDHDGSHIKGLLINFFHSNWPKVLQRRMLEEFITPIVKVTKGSQVLCFYTIPEFEEWQASIDHPKTWKVKYYKGLGTSTSKEAKSYFSEMTRHRIKFRYSGPDDDGCIDMAFNKKRADDRKEWLTNFMEERRLCRIDDRPEPGSTLYTADTRTLTYSDFINKELVMFSCADLERSVPSLCDGLKPGQRKVLYTCLRRNDKREVKVAQLAGSVAELSAYHHGETSLLGTIINMSQNFVGSNNLNLLQPIGQFGTRLHGGKDAASPRYIFTMLSPLTRLLFPQVDENLLTWLYDDNQKVEPSWYCPIIPTVLVNGTEGIGTGWSTKVPNHDIREVVQNVRRLINDEEPKPMLPSYKNFRGSIEEVEPNRYVVSGEAAVLDDKSVEITELPIKTWTQQYKENVLEPMVLGTEKIPQQMQEYKEYNTDITVRFIVKMTADKLREVERSGLHKFLSLQSSLSCNNTLVLFDEFGKLRKFNTTTEILKEFFHIRLRLYVERKDFMVGMLSAEAKRLTNQARFIVEKIEGKITIFNKAKKVLIKLLADNGYDSDPVKAWKSSISKKVEESASGDEESAEVEDTKGPDFNYILSMPLWSLSKERKEELLRQRDAKCGELEDLKKKTPKELWVDDLDKFMEELERVEQKEQDDATMALEEAPKKKMFGAKGRGKSKVMEKAETKPSKDGIRVEPMIDPALRARLTTQDKKPKIKKEDKKVKKEDTSTKKLETFFQKDIKSEVDSSDANGFDSDQPPSLLSRLKKSGVKAGTKQTTLGFKKSQKKNSADSGSESDFVGSLSVGNDSEDFVPTREKRARTTKTQVKKVVDSDLDSDDDSDKEKNADIVLLSDDESGSDKTKEKKDSFDVMMGLDSDHEVVQPKKTMKRKKKLLAVSDGDSSDKNKPPKKVAKVLVKKLDEVDGKRKKASPIKSKTSKKTRNVWSGSDNDDDDDELHIGDPDSPVQKRVTTGRSRKQTKYTFDSDEEDESDF